MQVQCRESLHCDGLLAPPRQYRAFTVTSPWVSVVSRFTRPDKYHPSLLYGQEVDQATGAGTGAAVILTIAQAHYPGLSHYVLRGLEGDQI